MREPTRTRLFNLAEAAVLTFGATAVSILVAIAADWITRGDVNPLEVFAVFTSYMCTWLCVREESWNYPVGVVTVTAYAFLFWQYDLIGWE